MRKLILASATLASLSAVHPVRAQAPAVLVATRGAAAADSTTIVSLVTWTDTIVGRCPISASPEQQGGVEAAKACAVAKVERRVQARLGTAQQVVWMPARSMFLVTGGQSVGVPGAMSLRVEGAEAQAVAVLSKGLPGQPAPVARSAAPVAAVTASPVAKSVPDATALPTVGRKDAPRTTEQPAEAARLQRKHDGTSARIAVARPTTEATAPAAPASLPAASLPAASLPAAPASSLPTRPAPAVASSPVIAPDAAVPPAAVSPAKVPPAVAASVAAVAAELPPAVVPGAVRAPASAATSQRASAVVPTVLMLRGDTRIRVIPGRQAPVPYTFSVIDSALLRERPDVRVHCKGTRALRAETIADPRGGARCALWLRAGTTDVQSLHIAIAGGRVKRTFRVQVEPLPAPSYAVRSADKACTPLAIRVERQLLERGVPVVGFKLATRRVVLSSCQDFARLAPVREWDVAPSGLMIFGEVDEPAADPFGEAAARVGNFTITTTKPGIDPAQDAAAQIVARLLKHLSL